ncbi:MAG: DUF805 domain-containing protein [Simkaniaceae bacterium]|jgi:uncharacterized membrane protein YhaH (DUF805 family)|nr:MAG: DUF805 domain-containing protein [Simkaniaceae bacterium]
MKLVIQALTKNYANFKGRARRKEYWLFTLATLLFSISATIVDSVLPLKILSSILQLFIIIPGLAVAVRRLHDIGKSGWYYLIALIPFVGWIIMIVWFCRKGQDGNNRFGPNPIVDDLVVA